MNSVPLEQMSDLLLAGRLAGGGWGYHRNGTIAVEPTALAALALDSVEGPQAGAFADVVEGACAQLAALQQPDGALGVLEKMPAPQWVTAWGALLWSVRSPYRGQAERAVAWLESHQGNTDLLSIGGPFSHNSTIPGWPWVQGTQSWLEPTALAVLALAACGATDHSRARQGRDLIRDRAIRTGGWNYGNSQVFGADLRAQPVPTGMALCALITGDDHAMPAIERACVYLERVLPNTRAPQSLAWGVLGLAACGRRPDDAERWIHEAFAKAVRRPDPELSVALLLMAASSGGLKRVGVTTSARVAT